MSPLAVAPKRRLTFALWDGTDPEDSRALASALGEGLPCSNFLDQPSAANDFVTGRNGIPKVFQPAGPMGDDYRMDDGAIRRGMFELPNKLLAGPHHGLSSAPHIVAVSGHGVPGFLFSESYLLMAASRPMVSVQSDWRLSPGSWSYDSDAKWNHPNTKVVLLSACRQLQGEPEQWRWANNMRGANPVHVLLGYHETAPSAATSAAINRRFVRLLRGGKPFVEAWRLAHVGDSFSWRWAALCYSECVADSMTEWAKTGELSSRPDSSSSTILYFDFENVYGRPVTLPHTSIDCWMTPRNTWRRLPPWTRVGGGAELDLHVGLLGEQFFEPGDTVSVTTIQVRYDYLNEFKVEKIFHPTSAEALAEAGTLTLRCLAYAGGTDTMDFHISRTVPSPIRLSTDRRTFSMPVAFAQRVPMGNHFPIFYFQVSIVGPNKRIGLLADQAGPMSRDLRRRIINDFQFAHFLFHTE